MKNDGYKIRDPQGIYFITFAIVEWVDVFTRKEYAAIIIESLRYCIQHKGLKVSVAAGSSLHSLVRSMRPCVNLKTSATNINLLTGK